ncbi:carbohydrate kinase family protein [Wenjunlia tyrosinilytica]|uniref:Carbohydrate kinase n=1 Tax=Wenjunlia tyrosinilytica TaxID=1544741 RepID=A0A917ZVC0_9ACTN|nr:carbohydrate kinase family protein [Wenjunlia tyrosinilytica]GGO94155.1 carbohydrate kinase [Wenjunlia tyrosinilytica]
MDQRPPPDPTAVPAPDVLLSGLLFFDLVLTGLGKPPTPGQEVWTRGMGCAPGGIANLAVAAARYGLRTSLAAAFGDDLYGAHCWEVLSEQEGIDLSLSRTVPGWHCPVTVCLAHGHDRALVTHGHAPPFTPDQLVGDPPAARAAIVHIGAEPQGWMEKAHAAGAKVFADVGWDPSQQWSTEVLAQLSLCHAFLPNEGEAMSYTRTGSAEAALSRLTELVPAAVVTRGREGALAVDQTTGETAAVPGLDIDVVDATGAGDVFGASFAAATLEGWPLIERLRFANLAAALSVRHIGGAPAAPGWAGIAEWWRAVERGADEDLRRDFGFLTERIPPPERIRAVHRAPVTLGFPGGGHRP